jgi:hypothetical protein
MCGQVTLFDTRDRTSSVKRHTCQRQTAQAINPLPMFSEIPIHGRHLQPNTSVQISVICTVNTVVLFQSLVAVCRPKQNVSLFSQTHYMGNMFWLHQVSHRKTYEQNTLEHCVLFFFWRWNTSGIHIENM